MRILVDTSMPSHWKMRRLGLVLADKNALAYVIRLWAWAFDAAGPKAWRAGRLDAFSIREIADVCEWDGPPRALIAGMVRVGLLDANPLRIHDWKPHNGRARHRYESEARRLRDYREQLRDEATAARRKAAIEDATGVRSTHGVQPAYVPGSLSGPSGSGSDKGEADLRTTTTSSNNGGGGGGGGVALTGWPERIWRAYPHHKKSRPNLSLFLTELAALDLTDDEGPELIKLLHGRKESGAWRRNAGQFVKKPHVWVEDEVRPWLDAYRARAAQLRGRVREPEPADEVLERRHFPTAAELVREALKPRAGRPVTNGAAS